MNFTVAFSVAGFGNTSAKKPADAICASLQVTLTASVREPLIPQAFDALQIIVPPVAAHCIRMDPPLDGPRITAPAGTDHV